MRRGSFGDSLLTIVLVSLSVARVSLCVFFMLKFVFAAKKLINLSVQLKLGELKEAQYCNITHGRFAV